jgi:uncharacterized DUF497 family protein
MDIFFDWDSDKNQKLIASRGVSFEEVVAILEGGYVLDILDHPNQKKYPNQQVYMVEINGYVHLVPFVKEKNKVFLKTIIPNRKAQKIYLGDQEE